MSVQCHRGKATRTASEALSEALRICVLLVFRLLVLPQRGFVGGAHKRRLQLFER